MGRIRSVVAVVAVSVVVGGAVTTIATLRPESPRDVPRGVSRDVPRDDDFVFMDDLPPDEQIAYRRIEIENLMIQGGEPYTQEDVDRELAELLEAERLFPQEVQDTPLPEGPGIPLEDTEADIVSIIVDDGR